MEKIYITTDTHFNHKNMVKYCNRPENFDSLIWDGLLNLPANCILIHLGDICMGNNKEVHENLKLLPYRKILVKGNHDKKTDSWYLNNGWDVICESFSNHYFGEYITFSHLPIENIQNMNIHGHFHNNLDRLLNKEYVVAGEKERNENILKTYNNKNHKLLALEYTNYKPILLEKFLNENRNRTHKIS